MKKNYPGLKNYLLEKGMDRKFVEFQLKGMELRAEIDYWIRKIRQYPDEEWESSESWYELVEVCHSYRKHFKSIYRKNGPNKDLLSSVSKLKKT